MYFWKVMAVLSVEAETSDLQTCLFFPLSVSSLEAPIRLTHSWCIGIFRLSVSALVPCLPNAKDCHKQDLRYTQAITKRRFWRAR
jgi:hypothetical protein